MSEAKQKPSYPNLAMPAKTKALPVAASRAKALPPVPRLEAEVAQSETPVSPVEAPVQPEGDPAATTPKSKKGQFTKRKRTDEPGAPKTEKPRTSRWGQFYHQFTRDFPDMPSADRKIEARKMYTPKKGQKTLTRIHKEVWMQRNPDWRQMSADERNAAIRKDFLERC